MTFDFRFSSRARGGSLHVTIQKSGTICVSVAAVKKFGLKDWDRVLFGYDRETNRIAIREDSEGVRFSPQGGGACRVFSAAPVLAAWGISHEKKQRLRATFENGMLIVHLGEESTN